MDPSGWEVIADQELLSFLRPYEAWRADWLIRCGLVTVQHKNGAKEKLNDPHFKLFKGEMVFVPIGAPSGGTVRDVLLPAGCRREMEEDANARARDFVFQAHPTDYERSVTVVLTRAHPNLTKIDADDLATFLLKLRKFDDAPVGTIHIVAHGSTRGNVNAQLRPDPIWDDDKITYESLDEAVKEITTIRAYPPLFLKPRPVDGTTKEPLPAALRIRACRVGVHATLLKKFKEALGPGIDVVSAPRFLHDAGTLGSRGLIEFFRHEFTLLSKRKLERPALIKGFQAGDLAFAPGPPTFFDGKAVPALAWNKWIPQRLQFTGEKKVDTEEMQVIIPVPGNPGRSHLKVHFAWDQFTVKFTRRMENEKPTSTADALAKLSTHINAIGASQRWSDLHPFPVSARLGYKNFDTLVENFDWTVDTGTAEYEFVFEGTRQEYSVLVPLTRGGELICNFYSNDPSIQSLQTFRDDDPRFFTSV